MKKNNGKFPRDKSDKKNISREENIKLKRERSNKRKKKEKTTHNNDSTIESIRCE